jgi:tetratricopeptide (TPR) repeat protein
MTGAMTLAQQGLLEEALFYVEKALAADSENQPAREMQAFLFLDLARNDKALRIFEQILQQDPRHFHALLGKGRSLLGMGSAPASLEYFNRALEIRPEDPEALMNKGLALYLSGCHDEAMDIAVFQEEFARKVSQEVVGKPVASP